MHPAPPRRPSLLCLLPTLMLGILPAACSRPRTECAGRTNDVTAEISFGHLDARVPTQRAEARGRQGGDRNGVDAAAAGGGGGGVPAMRAAAEMTLRARGYVITETYGTKDRARIEASGTGERRMDRTSVDVSAAPGATMLRIDCGNGGGATAAKAMLDEILARLGR